MIETNRLKIFVASEEQMKKFIDSQTVDELKVAYNEMLNGSLTHKDKWEWYAIWMIELKDGTHVGELCFKGISKDGVAEKRRKRTIISLKINLQFRAKYITNNLQFCVKMI